MARLRKPLTVVLFVLLLLLISSALVSAQSPDVFLPNIISGSVPESSVYAVWTALALEEDPLVRMPGTQPNQVSLESPNRCLNCHAGYNTEIEPGFNWQGSMMAQASRDFLFWSCLTVAGQDSIWAVGTPDAVDICERCHFPKGWLEGRSDPPNASAMTGADYDGVQCDFCHNMYDPFFETTHAGTREGNDWLGYWDETNASATPSQPAADKTYQADLADAQGILQFSGVSFFNNNLPPVNYAENGSGQYFVSSGGEKRGSFADADARHQMLYSRYHKSKYFCDSCHDVSNPVLANFGADPTQSLPTELNSAYSYNHVERTFSEFMLSAYGQPGGAVTNSDFQAQGAPSITRASKCQDCHMRDVAGVAANKQGAINRPTGSIEHPNSGQPLHDMTGGNAWVSWVLASAIPGSPNYDGTNDTLLNQGPAVLTLDLAQGQGIDPVALLAGVDRAKQQLALAVTIKSLTYDRGTGALSFEVQNNTGHKLISGFPEGRRMFVNVKAYAAGSLSYEVNPYDSGIGTLKGLPDSQNIPPLGSNEAYVDELVYEMHPISELTGENESFHFALATGRYKDNRIPPKGFDIANAAARLAEPVWQGVSEPGYFTDAEYAGGYDDVSLDIPAGADRVEVSLYYQTTSREYIEFLRDEINGTASTLTGTGAGGDTAYLVQTDPFFAQLKGWGDTIWQLWDHNKDKPGAAPILMAQATFGSEQVACDLTTPPTLSSATPGNGTVSLAWSTVPGATGYKVYYDQAGKAQFVADAGNTTSYVDSSVNNGQTYYYKITAYDSTCESEYSNIVSATPTNQGQATDPVGVTEMSTGVYTGNGKNRSFAVKTTFTAGDTVVIRARVLDGTGQPVSNATVEVVIGGPETAALNSGPSDADGWADATWQTQSPNRKGQGGTAPGLYTATTSNVTATGYHWDSVTTSTTFTVQ
ncbi:MAG: hypothetical protein ACK2UO_06685 [Caldilineaceae bacterium]